MSPSPSGNPLDGKRASRNRRPPRAPHLIDRSIGFGRAREREVADETRERSARGRGRGICNVAARAWRLSANPFRLQCLFFFSPFFSPCSCRGGWYSTYITYIYTYTARTPSRRFDHEPTSPYTGRSIASRPLDWRVSLVPPPPPLAFACRSMWCVRWTIGGPTPSQDIWRWRCFSVRVQVLCPSAVRARYLFLCSSCNCLHWIDSFWENSPASLHWIDSFWECLFSLLQIAARSII